MPLYRRPEPKVATLVVGPSGTKFADYITPGSADQTTINAAITALPANGGKIILREGSYSISAPIVINKSNVILEGMGQGTQITLANTSNANCINIGDGSSPYSRIKVRNLYIDGNMANNTGTRHGIAILAQITDAEVSGCYVKNTAGANIANTGGAQTRIVDNYCDTTKASSTWENITVTGGSAVLIQGNICVSGDYAGIGAYASRTLVLENYITGGGTDYIETGSDVVIEGNICYVTNNPTTGIIQINSNDVVCNGNYINIATGNTAAVWGIYLNGGINRLVITGNKITFATAQAHEGIRLKNSITGSSISNNIVINTTTITTGLKGISRNSTTPTSSTSLSICGNEFTSMDVGMELYFVSNSTIIGNNIYTSNSGAVLSGSINLNFSGNNINGKGSSGGIGISGDSTGTTSTNLQISNNTISEFANDGIIFLRLQYSSINGNNIINVGQATNNTYSGIILKTSTAVSQYNTIVGNNISSTATNKHKYSIREDTSSDGPNIVTNNVAQNAVTTNVSTQHVSTVVANNL